MGLESRKMFGSRERKVRIYAEEVRLLIFSEIPTIPKLMPECLRKDFQVSKSKGNIATIGRYVVGTE
jgi:hypothetical protein